MSHREKSDRVGEVVESSTAGFTAQCYKLYGAPPLGALVRTGAPEVYAVVASARTEPLDPGRPVLARGEGEESQEDVYRSNPQLARLLCTRFQATLVGFAQDGALLQRLPPSPPPIHAFVYPCTPQQTARFTGSLDFLHLLVGGRGPEADEVVAACLRLAASASSDPQAFLVRAGRAVAAELAGQAGRMAHVLRRLAP
jgi:hypothetical protein